MAISLSEPISDASGCVIFKRLLIAATFGRTRQDFQEIIRCFSAGISWLRSLHGHRVRSESETQLTFAAPLPVKLPPRITIRQKQVVELGKARYPVRRTPKRGLRQVDFVFDGNEIRGLEQNPDTKSRWAQMARSGKKVMQFLSEGRYVANVVDGKVNFYGGRSGT
jgi:hypothetical protein